MTTEELKKELTECLAEQILLDERADKLTARWKELLSTAGKKARIMVEIEGEVYHLVNTNHEELAIENARKFHGFYAGYRLVSKGKVIR